MKYTVYKVTQHGSRQLLLIEDSGNIGLAVYDEHTGSTLMRIRQPVELSDLKQAIEVLETGELQ